MHRVRTLVRAALTATAGLAVAGCGGAAAVPAGAPPLPADLLAGLDLPIDCGSPRLPEAEGATAGLVQQAVERYDFTADGVADAVVAVRCDLGAGSPPTEVYAIEATPAGPAVTDRLLEASSGEVIDTLDRDAAGDVRVQTFAYGPAAARCCPDRLITRTFAWSKDGFVKARQVSAPVAPAGAGR